MEHAQQLSALAGIVAAVQAHGRTLRLALHNTDRFGLIHLYFADGRLVRVEGHASDPARNLRDLVTWRHGAVRVDHIAPKATDAASPDALEAELAAVLAEMEHQGAVYPVPPAVAAGLAAGRASPHAGASHIYGLPSLDEVSDQPVRGSTSGRLRVPTGAPLRQPQANGSAHSPDAPDVGGAATGAEPRLTEPQWQLLALALRQVTEHAAQLLGGRIAESMLRQSLAQAVSAHPFLAGLTVDQTGWLRAPGNGYAESFATLDAAEAVAALLGEIEARASAVAGEKRAHEMIASALMPFRVSLQQMGLQIRMT